MIRATLYIMACTSKNRIRRRLARLKEPRYLFGALVGSAYLYFSIFGRMRMNQQATARGRAAASASTLVPGLAATAPLYGGLGLLLAAAFTWLMPVRSRLLEFTPTEVAMLFPAPVTRRQLLLYRVMRSQVAVLFGSLIFALVFPRGSMEARVRGLLSVWLLLSTTQVFFAGSSLLQAKERLTGRVRGLQSLPKLLTILGVLLLAIGLGREVMHAPVHTMSEAVAALNRVLGRGLMPLVLWPFAALVRPLFTPTWIEFALALGPAVAVYLGTAAWALLSDEGFDSVSEGVAERQSARPVGPRKIAYRARPIAWQLAPQGRPEAAFLWKAMLQTFRVIDRRVLIRVVVLVVWSAVIMTMVSRTRGIAQAIGVFAAMASAFAVLLGPQIVRTDLRQDLQQLEAMKTWPVRAASVVRGEMAWPAMLVTAVAWGLAALALILSQTTFSSVGTSLRLSIGIAAMVMAPGLIFAQFTVHNAAALLFPAWIASGQGRPRGVDAMGQRMIMFSGVLLVLILAMLPAVLIGGVLWFAFFRFIGPWILVPSALIGLVIVGLEVLMATEALGPAYERLDITSVERAE